jgi:AcrR family transcriptional regulator
LIKRSITVSEDSQQEVAMSSAPRKKAARKSPQERAAEIARAACDLALEQGLAAVTLRAVAARIDVAPALVAHYEPNMDTLVAATFGTIVAAELTDIRAVLAALPTPTARIAALVDTLLDGTRDEVTVVWVEAWALGRRSEPLADAVRAQMDAWQAVVQQVVENGIRSGEFETTDAADVAWQLLGMIDGLNAQALVRWNHERSRGSVLHRAVEGMLGLERSALDAALRAD